MRSAVLLLCAGLALAQTPTTSGKKCLVEGRVLNAQTGAPVPRARVTLVATPVSGAGGVVTSPGSAGSGAAQKSFEDTVPTMLSVITAPVERSAPAASSGGVTGGGVMVAPRQASTPSAPSAANVNPPAGAFALPPAMPTAGRAIPSRTTATTDGEGRFVFTAVEPGDYQISARRDNFSFDARRAGNISLRAGDEKRDVLLRVAPLGAISGYVRGDDGDPLQNIQVSLLGYAYSLNGRQLSARGSAMTNDLGEFRLFGVPAGKYHLRAGPTLSPRRPDDDEAFVTLYYPGSLDLANAAQLDLTPGQEMRGVEFTLQRSRRVTLRGTVAVPAGATGVSVGVTMRSENSTATTTNSVNNPEGNFVLRGFSPGMYTLTARATLAGKQLNATLPIQVGTSDIEGIGLRLTEATNLKGRIVIEDGGAVKPSGVRVTLQGRTMGGHFNSASVRNFMDSRGNVTTTGGMTDDGSFTISEPDADVYSVSVSAPDGVYLKSARCGNSDVLGSGLDLTGGIGCDLVVVVSPAGGQVEGVVQNGDQPVSGAIVTLAQSETRRTDLFKSAMTDSSGRFQFAGVAPGNYRLHAWDDVDVNAVRYDPDFLKSHENDGSAVRVTERGRETVALKLIK